MEVMKSGAIVSTLDLRALCSDNGRGYVTFGRAPDNDVLLDHPSSSRLHAIVQFNAKDGAAFLYDPGSTHGTSLNKKRIPPNEHVPLHVGDQLVFGESSRVHILGGPADLMPEEGPSREQRRQAAAMELYRRRKEREAEVAKSQMAAAIAKGAAGAAGVTWGMREDAEEEIDEAGDVIIDWRAHAATKGLTEKQQKIADKIRKRELRIQNLQKECDRIRTKERAMEELSAGQASTLVRNEQEMDKAVAEMEELEETLVESIRDSIQGKRKAAGDHDKTARKRRRAGSDDDDASGGSEDDMFFDKTAGKEGGKRKRRVGAGDGGKGGKGVAVEDAASLFGKLEALKEEKGRLVAALAAEEAAEARRGKGKEPVVVEGKREVLGRPGCGWLDAWPWRSLLGIDVDRIVSDSKGKIPLLYYSILFVDAFYDFLVQVSTPWTPSCRAWLRR